ncbi:MAG: hypothetical protein OHK0023_05070 [Anaerolineae bacterium]
MDSIRFSAIAHSLHTYHSPVHPTQVDYLIDLMRLSPTDRVFDAGCGSGAYLIRIAEKTGARGVGVDISPYAIETARTEAARRVPQHPLEFVESHIDAYTVTSEAFEAALCIGATHLYHTWQGAIDVLSKIIKRGGQMLIGDLYWKQPPSESFLALMGGMARDEMHSYTEMVQALVTSGLTPLYVADSSLADWDHYEWLYRYAVIRHLQAHPDDAEAQVFRQRSDSIMDRFLTGGREFFGFMVCLAQRPY